jgi:uncharacterized protein
MNNSTTFMQWIEASPFRKNIASVILVFIALALITTTVLLYKSVSHFGVSAQYPQTINVMGKAEEYVKPDTLTFSITVNEEGKDVAATSKKVDDKVAQAISILKANGVEEKNIKTTYRDVNDTYGNQPCVTASTMAGTREIALPGCTTSKINGVSVYQTLEVKVPDIDKDADGAKREKMIGELSAAGIKTGQISFTVYDIEAVKVRVRAEAIKKAREDAKVLARSLGVSLDGLQGFSDNGGGNPYAYGRDSVMAAPVMDKSAVSNAVLPTGEQKVTTEVTLSYLIK